MAYSYALDPSTPASSDLLANGDNEIRNLKAAILERLGSFLDNLPDGDPLVIKLAALAAVYPKVGLHSARPALATFPGQQWYSYDTKQLFIGLESLAWHELLLAGTKVPTILALGSPADQRVLLVGNPNVKSFKLEKEGGGWDATRDGAGGYETAPVPAGETWTIKATVFSDPAGDVSGTTLQDSQTIQVLGAGASPPPQSINQTVSPPSLSSNVMSYTVDGDGDVSGMKAEVFYTYDEGTGWSNPPQNIRTINPVPTSATMYTHLTDYNRMAEGRDIFAKITVELRVVATGVLVASTSQFVGWKISELL
jgi:hypothetical protein